MGRGIWFGFLKGQIINETIRKTAKGEGLYKETFSEALGIDTEEIRRVLRGEGVSYPAVWQVIKKHLRMD